MQTFEDGFRLGVEFSSTILEAGVDHAWKQVPEVGESVPKLFLEMIEALRDYKKLSPEAIQSISLKNL